MANLFRMTTGGGGTIGIDPSPYGTGIKAVITGEAPINAEQATLDATTNPAVESDTRKWNITSGSDIEDVITLETEIWTPSTVVNLALDDGVASHTRAEASDVVTGKYFWDADGEYKVGTAQPAKISTSYETIANPTVVTHNATQTYQTVTLSYALNKVTHAFYIINAAANSVNTPKVTNEYVRGIAVVPKANMVSGGSGSFYYNYKSTDGTTTDGRIYWRYVDDTHLEFANTFSKDLYISVSAIAFTA